MRLPCERYLKFRLLEGVTPTYLLSLLDKLGYAPSKKLEAYADALVEVTHKSMGNDRLIANFVNSARLSRVWYDPLMTSKVKALVETPDVRFTIETLLSADHNHQLVSNVVEDAHRIVIPDQVIRMYSHLVWDLKSLSKWELDLLFETHRAGLTYRVVYCMGHQVALLYTGVSVDVDKEEELKFIRSSAMAKYREATLSNDALVGSAAAKRWMHIFTAANEQLGPMDVIRKLIDRVQRVKPDMAKLETVPFRELESVSGLTRGVAMLGDATPEMKSVEKDGETGP